MTACTSAECYHDPDGHYWVCNDCGAVSPRFPTDRDSLDALSTHWRNHWQVPSNEDLWALLSP